MLGVLAPGVCIDRRGARLPPVSYSVEVVSTPTPTTAGAHLVIVVGAGHTRVEGLDVGRYDPSSREQSSYTAAVTHKDAEAKSTPHWAQVLAWLTGAVVAVIGLAWTIYTYQPPNHPPAAPQNDSLPAGPSPVPGTSVRPQAEPAATKPPIFTRPNQQRPPSPPVKPHSPPGTVRSASGGGLTVTVRLCRKAADLVRCEMLVVPDRDTRYAATLVIHKSAIIDAQGREFRASTGSLADGDAAHIGGRDPQAKLFEGVPTTATLVFPVSGGVGEIQQLSSVWAVDSVYKTLTVQIRGPIMVF